MRRLSPKFKELNALHKILWGLCIDSKKIWGLDHLNFKNWGGGAQAPKPHALVSYWDLVKVKSNTSKQNETYSELASDEFREMERGESVEPVWPPSSVELDGRDSR